LVAVSVKVVVTKGLTTIEPDDDTGPIPGVRVTELATVVDQDSVTDPPGPIEVAEAVTVAVGGGGSVGGVTFTSTDRLTGPARLVAVSVKVVSDKGETTIEPEDPTGTIPGARVTKSAPVVDQDNVTDPPSTIELVEAVSVAVGRGSVTVTSADDVTEPERLVAVSVKVVVAKGSTTIEPEAATGPIPGPSVTRSAPVVDQDKVTDPPVAIELAEAVSVAVGSGGSGVGAVTFTSTDRVAGPARLVAVSVNIVVDKGMMTIEPEDATGPIPGSSVTTSASLVDQDKVTDPPGPIEVSEAVSAAVGSGGRGFRAPLPSPTLPWTNWTRRKLTTSCCDPEDRAAYALAEARPSPP
jgi:hypothetical protein